MAKPQTPVVPSQVAHPWREATRTAFQVAAGLAASWPAISAAIGAAVKGQPYEQTVLAASGIALLAATLVSHVMRIPIIDQLLTGAGLGCHPRTRTDNDPSDRAAPARHEGPVSAASQSRGNPS